MSRSHLHPGRSSLVRATALPETATRGRASRATMASSGGLVRRELERGAAPAGELAVR